MTTPPIPFVIRHFTLGVLGVSVAKSVFHLCSSVAQIRDRVNRESQIQPLID